MTDGKHPLTPDELAGKIARNSDKVASLIFEWLEGFETGLAYLLNIPADCSVKVAEQQARLKTLQVCTQQILEVVKEEEDGR